MLCAILLGLLLLFLLLLFVPLSVSLRMADQDIRVVLRIFRIIPIPLYRSDAPEKPKKAKTAKKKKEKSSPSDDGQKPADRIISGMEQLQAILAGVKAALSHLLRRVRLRADLSLLIGKGDAAETALAVGRAYAVGHSLHALLENIFSVRHFSLSVTPDFLEERQSARVDASVSFRLSTLLVAAALFLIRGGMAALPARREKACKQSRNRAKAAPAPFANHKTKERAGA